MFVFIFFIIEKHELNMLIVYKSGFNYFKFKMFPKKTNCILTIPWQEQQSNHNEINGFISNDARKFQKY